MALQSNAAKQGSMKGDFGDTKSSNAPATWYLAYFTDSSMATELTGTGGISRVAIANTTANFTVSSSGVVTNVSAINSAASTGAWASSANFAALMDAATAGNAWDGGNLTSAVTVSAAGTVVQMAASALSISA